MHYKQTDKHTELEKQIFKSDVFFFAIKLNKEVTDKTMKCSIFNKSFKTKQSSEGRDIGLFLTSPQSFIITFFFYLVNFKEF